MLFLLACLGCALALRMAVALGRAEGEMAGYQRARTDALHDLQALKARVDQLDQRVRALGQTARDTPP